MRQAAWKSLLGLLVDSLRRSDLTGSQIPACSNRPSSTHI